MKRTVLFAILVLAVLFTTPIFAASQTSNLAVSATVITNCSISTTPVAFGNYDPTAAADLGSTGTITGSLKVRCTNGTAATVGLGVGSHASGTARRMLGPSATDFLTYELYSDNAVSSLWGSTIGTDTVAYNATNAAETTLTVYGKAPKNQNAVAGAYSDTVVASINY